MRLVTQNKNVPSFFPLQVPRSQFDDSEYLAMMCHEIATPLCSIVGLAHILSDVKCSPQKKIECARMLRDSSEMLMGLMKNMLDSAKMNAGMIEIEEIEFDLAKLVKETVDIIAVKAEEKGLALLVHIAGGLPPQCMGDPLRIRQILLNLLSNAIKFTENGEVSLYVKTTHDMLGNDQLCITITDTGIGISAEALKNIFGKHKQANTSISREYAGTGLGLSISQELAHLMHGDLSAESQPGVGSHFIVTLPLRRAASLLAVA